MIKIKRALLWIWEQIKFPAFFVCILWLSGFGMYQGFITSERFAGLLQGKVLLITLVDLNEANDD
ncbi:hypothetical protein SAMN05216302_101475 [Nitrosomonas aestuarii]|uniref:Uncharacterized protein n=1 Tax=Nitrosomonas aestuarii TaxID=52441 RepID=A0A1I4C5S7_9PROT|nr:hypothetical protein [Nitrosomonas aestuarii]SFK75516.1 hypothetical protein SAMN05216302_101475 [Nitrosomonas aestuarii]